MRWMFVFLVTLLIASDFLGRPLGLGPGLSIKNACLYAVTLALMFRIALSGNFKLRMPGLHMAWALWIGYAVLTFLTAWLVIHYRNYNALLSAIALKSDLIDSAMFCFVVFYGVQTEKDFRTVMIALMAAIGISSALTLTDLAGITALGTRVGDKGAEADRVFGAFGNANETGALLGCMLPGVIAMVMSVRGFWRLFWIGCATATGLVFVLTVSRGAYVGVAVGYTIAVLMFRQLIPPGRIFTWVISGMACSLAGAVIVVIAQPDAAASIAERVLGIGTMGISEASSGRTDIWAQAVAEMMENPISLLTGFGWNVYSTMPTTLVTHNTYLDQWFNLGLPGLLAYAFIYYNTIRTAKQAAAVAMPPLRGNLIAYAFGMLALAVTVFFVN
ncbi:MAG TPA: O-antigen ligase family protein, partial [Steroidobacteraceae bacterium]